MYRTFPFAPSKSCCGVEVRDGASVEKLTSGPTFNARTVSLCSQSLGGAVNSTHRMGTLSLFASFTQCARVSRSAFVLSISGISPHARRMYSSALMFLPTTTDVPSSTSALADLRHFSRCFHIVIQRAGTLHSTCCQLS